MMAKPNNQGERYDGDDDEQFDQGEGGSLLGGPAVGSWVGDLDLLGWGHGF
ncbi:MAG: hypothetical protein M5U12_04535 [Verrucomicrobia bacterium]|nr:hypothetical protein [Verrucomicrobiota bacterium]